MKRFLLTLSAALGIGVTLAAPAAWAQDTETPRFPANGKLKIAVFSDVQTTQNVPANLLENLNIILDQEKPDLVVYLGDQVEGEHPYIHMGNNEAHVKCVIDQVLSPAVERNIPFAIVLATMIPRTPGLPRRSRWTTTRLSPAAIATLDGIDLAACPGASYTSYNDGNARGVRLIEIDETAGDYSTRVIRFRDLEKPGLGAAVRRFLGQPHLWELEVPLAAFVAVNAIFWPLFLRRRKKSVRKKNKV